MDYEGNDDWMRLQKRIRADPEGYRSEFLLQLRHFDAALEIFRARPDEPSKEFSSLVRFIASVSDAFPNETQKFVGDLLQLLEKSHEVLDRGLRKALVQSLMQLRQKRRLEMMELMPLFFRLFRCKDKALREMIFGFIVADVKASNRKARGQQLLDRQMKRFLLETLKDSDEMIAKKALAILTDLWRRQIWHDVHTANVIVSAMEHPNNTVMYATVKFFLGYDLKQGEEDDDGDREEDDDHKLKTEAQLCAEDVYRAQKKGTRTSKKKKAKKLKRVKTALMRHARRQNLQLTEQFAAIQLLQDPYKIADILFSRTRSGRVTSQARLAMIRLLSRIIAVHRLVMLNFYPYLQKYLFPGGRDVVTILGALVEGCHEMVPPDALEAVLRQVVDRFVHDHARPEVITIGLKTVREMCSRAPLIMNVDLLSDLVLYRKFKDAEVKASAKGLISLFREIAPDMLPRKERGRDGLLPAPEPLEFGKIPVYERLEGAELLQEERTNEQDQQPSESMTDMDSDSTSSPSEEEEDESCGTSAEEETEEMKEQKTAASHIEPGPTSLNALRKKLAMLKQQQQQQQNSHQSPNQGETSERSTPSEEECSEPDEMDDSVASSGSDELLHELIDGDATVDDEKLSKEDPAAVMPIEMTTILEDADFDRLQELKRDRVMKHQLKKHGLLPGNEPTNNRLIATAEAEAEELLKHRQSRTHLSESGLNPTDLLGKKRGKANKTERMLSVLRGREDAEPRRSRSAMKKRKTGGLSNKEKIKRKDLPLKGRMAQAKKRKKLSAIKKKGKNFKGHIKTRRH